MEAKTMTPEITVEVSVAIDQKTDELVMITNETKTVTRKALRAFLSLPDGSSLYVDEKWRIHIDTPDNSTIISDPIPNDLRYIE